MNNEYNLIKSLINNQDFKKYNTLFLNSILPYFYRSNDNLNSENLFKKYYEDNTENLKNFRLMLIKNSNKTDNTNTNLNFNQLYFNDYLVYNTYYASSYYDLMRNYYIKNYNINSNKKYTNSYLKNCKSRFKSSYQFSSLYTKNKLKLSYI